MSGIHDDLVVATAELASRAGATNFKIAHLRGDPDDAGWFAVAYYQGARLSSPQCPSPSAACLALAERMLSGATCRCRQPVTLSDSRPGCRWRLAGPRWEPGCDAPPIVSYGALGDVDAMRRALDDAPG